MKIKHNLRANNESNVKLLNDVVSVVCHIKKIVSIIIETKGIEMQII